MSSARPPESIIAAARRWRESGSIATRQARRHDGRRPTRWSTGSRSVPNCVSRWESGSSTALESCTSATLRICSCLVALPLIALGSALIYDHHDACPELMIAKGHREDGWQVRLARLFERLTYRFSDVSIETNDSYRDIALGRGRMSGEDVFVVRSAPAADRFACATPDDEWRHGRKYLVGYVGVMGIQDGLDYLIDAARVIIKDWWREDIQFVLVGSGPELPRLRERAASAGISDQVLFTGRLSEDDLGAVLATADVCVNPDEANRMNDISTMNKVLEYMALAKPIVQFDLHEGRMLAGGSSLYATRKRTRPRS